MTSLAHSNYDKNGQLDWEVPKLIHYITLLKGDRYFNWNNVPISEIYSHHCKSWHIFEINGLTFTF